MTSSNAILIGALRTLARDIQSQDGMANAAIAEAADQMEMMKKLLERAADIIHYQYPSEPSTIKWLADTKEIGIEPCPF